MGNLRRSSSSSNNNNIGWFKRDGGDGCKKHSKHRQSAGVCSLCLREKLTQLSIIVPTITSSSSRSPSLSSQSSSESSSYVSSLSSSYLSSSCASPNYNATSSIFFLHAKHGQRCPRQRGGFWYRLLHPTTI